jgi:hypothetical protein
VRDVPLRLRDPAEDLDRRDALVGIGESVERRD